MSSDDNRFAHNGLSTNFFEVIHYFKLTHMDDLLVVPQGDTGTAELDDDTVRLSEACVSNWFAPVDDVQEETTTLPDSVRCAGGDEDVSETDKSTCCEDAVVSRGVSSPKKRSRFVMRPNEAHFSMPSLQDLPSRSVSGILQWYRAASKELMALHKLTEEGDKKSCETGDASRELPENVAALPNQRALVAHQRQLLIDLASSTTVVFQTK
ncbi:hypothetical protein TGVAND_219610 [Toxoplasma gondii VAND]|uniref:Uncharacterized protein n=3 Tax=Toxoplasma gondii TaxID=5811 RepID=A0A086L307_TOXGO|nr:hypothetical protein TGFOU_219610 [Toxoplasma gondii FOU]KFH05068.1 hypothetical protein TGVAND_219610 [Toxoplasma gondii VAND]PUA88843.1 hypothetical protein TGBR9_219610 [Toxoplasma gondii TgCATBr9]